MTRAERRVVRTAMRLFKHWAESSDPLHWPEGFWYPLGSKKQAIPFGKACAALAKVGK